MSTNWAQVSWCQAMDHVFSSLSKVGELGHGELYPHLDGAERAGGLGGDLALAQALRSRRARWCAAARAAASPSAAATRCSSRRRCVSAAGRRRRHRQQADGFVRGACDRSSGDVPCAQAVDGAAARDGDDPGDGAASSGVELGRPPPHFQEGLLDDVLGLFPVPQDPERDRDRPRARADRRSRRSAATSPRATRARSSRSRARSVGPVGTAATNLAKHSSILGAPIASGSGAANANQTMFCLSYG